MTFGGGRMVGVLFTGPTSPCEAKLLPVFGEDRGGEKEIQLRAIYEILERITQVNCDSVQSSRNTAQ